VRLARSGFTGSLAEYRLEQMAWAGSGAAAGMATAFVLAGVQPLGLLALGIMGGLLGGLTRQWQVARKARMRRQRVDEQLPAVAELLAFAVAAGDTPFTALTRAVSTTDGDLAHEVQLAVADMQAGRSLEAALRGMADRVGSPELDRFVDGLVVSVERGTPVAETLRAQAADARATSRQRLMELAGRKDVLMLVPVVFLILPTVIAVALLPGLQGMRVIAP
jgi:tight adherence protein C